jgi:CHAD domain-containing protein
MKRPQPGVTRALLERRARALKRHLPAAIAGDIAGVHKARVASRRLREAVPVLGGEDSPGKAHKAARKLRKVTRALGGVRELDVTLGLIDELARKGTLPRVGLEEVRTHVVEERERQRTAMLKRLGKVDLDRLAGRLAAIAAALQEPGSERWRETLSGRIEKRAKALEEAVASAGQMYNPERLHQVRIAAKKLRYSLEIAADGAVPSAPALLRHLKRTQETLGRLHDLQVLETHVGAVAARPRLRVLLRGSLAKISRALEETCRYLHSRYVAAAPGRRGVVEAAATTVIPQLTLRRRTARTSQPVPRKTVGRPPRARAAVRAAADSGEH